MSDVLKVIEIQAESDQSWEDAAQRAVDGACKTLNKGVKSVRIKNFEAKIKDGKIAVYRVNAKVSFSLEE